MCISLGELGFVLPAYFDDIAKHRERGLSGYEAGHGLHIEVTPALFATPMRQCEQIQAVCA
jgi:hypothetical protein